MSVQMAAATGNLKWKNTYDKHKSESEKTLQKITKLVSIKKAKQITKDIENYLYKLNKIEKEAFKLISRGKKGQAADLLTGWKYTKNHLNIEKSTKKLSKIIHKHIQENISRKRKLTFLSLVLVFSFLLLLIISWFITIKKWRIRLKQRKEKEKEIVYLSYHDVLTDLYNRRYFMKAGRKKIEKTKYNNQSLLVMMLDIDHFKKVNDNYGHAAGDKALEHIATLIKENTRQKDIKGRLGGEEFGIILPDTNCKNAVQIAERVRKNIEENPTRFNDNVISVTVSIGIAELQSKLSNLDDLLQAADKALYKAKRRGRNCIVKYEI